MSDFDYNTVFDAGFRAARDGGGYINNPYPHDTGPFDAWEAGFDMWHAGDIEQIYEDDGA